MLAVVLHDGARRGRGMAFLGAVGFVWLLFLPNAPYIVTDFVHVGRVSGVPVWYDAAMIASFAGVGLVLGLVSILLVQGVVERRFGAAVGWLMLAPVFFLCSAGIYIGRVHRLNSWDAITSPGTLLRGFADRLADPLAQPEAIVALVGAMGLLTVAYLVLYTISDLTVGSTGISAPNRGENASTTGVGGAAPSFRLRPSGSSRRTPGSGSG